MFVPMLLLNEPKLMMVTPSSTTSARSSIAVPPMASKATSSLCPPGLWKPALSNCYHSLNRPAGQEERIGAFQQTDSISPDEWGGDRDPKQRESANAQRQMLPHSDGCKREA